MLAAFNDAGVLAAADVHVARRLAALFAEPADGPVALAVALAVRAPRLGHVFVDLATIRDTATVEGWLDKGIDRVIIGTAAVRDPPFVKQVARDYPGKIAVGLDARGGKVAVQGWAETSELSALEIARRFEDAGVAAIIYTDVARDGMLQGLNLDATIALAEAISIPVIASGGFASIDDIKALLEPRARKLQGAIAGRALYDGRLDAAEALKLIRDARAAA